MKRDIIYNTKVLMSLNLTHIIELRDNLGVCQNELALDVPINEYEGMIYSMKFMKMEQLEDLYSGINKDHEYLKQFRMVV